MQKISYRVTCPVCFKTYTAWKQFIPEFGWKRITKLHCE